MLFEYLNALDMTVLVTQDGVSGIRLAEQEQPDVILLDVMMPQLDGFETCRRLKALDATRDIPVLFMTALTDTVNKIHGFELGAVDYITKPIEQEEVVARINAHVTIARQQKRMLRFFSILAHELRSPFSSLVHMTATVAANAADWEREQLVERIDAIHQTCSNIYRLTDNLLTWARLQQHRETVEREEISLREIVMETLVVCHEHAEEKLITLSHRVDTDLRVLCDRNMLLTVLRNLVTNALKFTHKGGSVHLTADAAERSPGDADRQHVFLRIRDSGIGIANAVLPLLFQLDTKIHTVGTNGEQGTGLGLILCREMLQQNGGELTIESEEGQGTTVSVLLPCTPLSTHNRLPRSAR